MIHANALRRLVTAKMVIVYGAPTNLSWVMSLFVSLLACLTFFFLNWENRKKWYNTVGIILLFILVFLLAGTLADTNYWVQFIK